MFPIFFLIESREPHFHILYAFCKTIILHYYYYFVLIATEN